MTKQQPPFKLNDIIEVNITGLGSSGEGVGKADGFTVFVHGALPGEKVSVKLFQVKKSYASGRILNILEESPQRVKPQCAFYEKCGGCQLQHLNYEGQLSVKRQQVKDAIERIGHITGCEVLPVLGMENPWHYRYCRCWAWKILGITAIKCSFRQLKRKEKFKLAAMRL